MEVTGEGPKSIQDTEPARTAYLMTFSKEAPGAAAESGKDRGMSVLELRGKTEEDLGQYVFYTVSGLKH